MDNYGYVVSWVREQAPAGSGSVRILDYGCGQGLAVKMLRDAGFDCCGCDAFVQVGKPPREHLLDPAWFGTVIRDMPEGRILFAAEAFDNIR